MNIYIRPDLQEHLRKEKSMSGLVNKLLHDHYDKLGYNIQRPVEDSSMVEQRVVNPKVVGSSPTPPAKDIKHVADVQDLPKSMLRENTVFITKSHSARRKK